VIRGARTSQPLSSSFMLLTGDQSSQLSRILHESHAFSYSLKLSRKRQLISRILASCLQNSINGHGSNGCVQWAWSSQCL